MLRDGGTYVEMGQFTNAGSIDTNWHRFCTKDINLLGSWAFTADDIWTGIKMLDRVRDKYPFAELQMRFPFTEQGIIAVLAGRLRTGDSGRDREEDDDGITLWLDFVPGVSGTDFGLGDHQALAGARPLAGPGSVRRAVGVAGLPAGLLRLEAGPIRPARRRCRVGAADRPRLLPQHAPRRVEAAGGQPRAAASTWSRCPGPVGTSTSGPATPRGGSDGTVALFDWSFTRRRRVRRGHRQPGARRRVRPLLAGRADRSSWTRPSSWPTSMGSARVAGTAIPARSAWA